MRNRDTRAIIDLKALQDNYETFSKLSQKEVFAVVKANAYGHGMVECSKALIEKGASVLCVVSLDEALYLVKHDIKTDILILGYVDPKSAVTNNQSNFIFSIPSKVWMQEVIDLKGKLRVHLEINTGMNRLGVKDINDAKWIVDTYPHRIEGIFTHFTSSEENEHKTKSQLEIFKKVIKVLNTDFDKIHASNTHGSFKMMDSILNAVRVGIGLYGYSNFSDALKPVLSLETKVIHIDSLLKGETLGYNETHKASKDGLFGTLSIGYADGFDVRNRGLDVYIKNKPYPIIGKICMDQCMIEIDESVSLGDRVELIGPHRSAKDIANHIGVIPYIILATLNPLIQRIYKK